MEFLTRDLLKASLLATMGFLPIQLGCRRDRPVQATSLLGRSWLSVKRPESEGAVGYLVTDDFSDAYPCDLIMARTSRQAHADAFDLLKAPFVAVLAEGGETPTPAVFDVEGDRCLVSSPQGWAWMKIQKPYRFVPYEQCLDDLLALISKEGSTHPLTGQRAFHDGWVISLEAQPLKVRPADDAPGLPLAIPDHFVYANATWVGLKEGQNPWEDPQPSIDKIRVTGEDRSNGSLVRVLQRQGDWVQVMLPVKGERIYFTDTEMEGTPGLVVAWDPATTGWARWRGPGKVPGTTRVGFSASYWGYQD